MGDGDRHVVPNSSGGWDVKALSAKRASSHHDTQAEAVERAREIIRNKGGGRLTVHGEDGHVLERRTVSAAAGAAGSGAAPKKAGGSGAKKADAGATRKAATAPAPVRPARRAAPEPATAEPADAVVALRSDGGLAETDRPATSPAAPTPPAVTTAAASPAPAPRPTFGERLKRLFGRTSH